ncbi:MAG: universal stress protein [Bacteroidota bacterium]
MIHILCPVDFSDASLNALDHAVNMCSTCQGALTLLYVFNAEEFIQVAQTEESSQEALHGAAEIRLKGLVQEIRSSEVAEGIQQTDYIMRVGDLVNSVVDYAEHHKSQMIVMGTTGVGTMREAFIGSNTVQVFEKAPCPVLCVPADATYVPVKELVYATDYERDDQKIVKQVVAMASEFDATVEVLHIEKESTLHTDERYQEYVENLSSYIMSERLSFQRDVCDDDIPHCLDRYMDNRGAQILALLTHNHNFLQKLVKKSIAKNLAYFTDSPLLIYKN